MGCVYLAAMKFLEELNESQRVAVEQTEGPVLIIAGAGSGKTRVLTCRIALQLLQGGNPFQMLALTFTNKAAREMKDRIHSLTGPVASSLWMGTFHSIFARILRVEHEKLNFPSNFTIYDTEDSKNLLKDVIRGMGLDDKTYKPDQVLWRISSAKNNMLGPEAYANHPDFSYEDRSAGRSELGAIYRMYEKRCLQSSAMDFDDLLFKTYILLNNDPGTLHKYQHKFKYLLVDEFQDTNHLQYLILRKLAAVNQNICVVGDDAQSIYAFRGASIKNILSFSSDYPDLKTFRLEQNYRSTANIVSVANSLIVHNKAQLRKNVWTENPEGEKIKVIRTLTDQEEGNTVAREIYSEKMNGSRPYRHFGVLYRTNAQSRALEEALRKMNIPYRIFGGLSFYKRKEIKDLLAYFRLAINHADEEAFKRVLNFPPRGIGDTSLERMMVEADRLGTSIWSVAENIELSPLPINGPTKKRISDFAVMIKSFAVSIRNSEAYEAAKFIATQSGIMKEFSSRDTPEEISRFENIQELLNAIKEFSDREENPVEVGENQTMKTLDLFMQDVALLTDAEEEDKTGGDYVSLMTIHAAKGLEFPFVYVAGMEEDLFPSQFMMSSREDLEEERRLFYVALTRAMNKLTLTFALSRYRWGKPVSCQMSRFVDELDPAFLQMDVPKKPAWGNQDQVFQSNRRDYFVRPTSGQGGNAKTVSNPAPPPGFTKVRKNAASPQFSNSSEPPTPPLSRGMKVEHAAFGTGTVITVEGNFPDQKAEILFEGGSKKQLLLKFAKLKIIEN